MLSHTITGIGDGDAFDNNTALNASLVTDDQRAGLYIFGQNRHRSAYDHDGDGYSEIPKIHGQTIGFRSFLKTTTYSKLTFEYHHMEEFRRGGDLLNRPPHEANVAEQTEHSINGGGLNMTISHQTRSTVLMCLHPHNTSIVTAIMVAGRI